MKIVIVVQILFSGLACLDSLLLAMEKTRYIEEYSTFHNVGEVVDYIPPSAHYELFLLGCGVTILACAILQKKAHIRFSCLQVLLGTVITSTALFFSIRAATIGHFEYSALYYVVYALAGLGVVVCIVGFCQMKSMGKTVTSPA